MTKANQTKPMKKVKSAKKNPIFWKAYIIFILVLVTAAIVGTGILISWLDAFEQSQPIHSAQAVFDEYFKTEKWSEILKLSGYEMGPLEKEGDAESALMALKEGKTMSFYSVDADDTSATYNVVLVDPEDVADTEKSDSEVKDATAEMAVKGIPSTKIATITLKKHKKEGEWGFKGYEFDSLEVFLKREESAELIIPADCTLYAGETAIDAAEVVEFTEHEWNQHLPEGIKGVQYATYRFSDLLKVPEFSVRTADGTELPLVKNEESGIFEAEIPYATNVDQALADRLLKGLEEYAAYMQDDGSLGRVSRYFDTKSDFYKSTASNPSSFVWDHQGYEFQNEIVENFYFFDENTLCCYISFDQVLKMTGRENYVDHLSMTVYAHKVNGTWRIFNCVNS